MNFDDLIPEKDAEEKLQPPVAGAGITFDDVMPGELEETAVLPVGDPNRERKGIFYPVSTDIYAEPRFDPNVGLLGGIRRGGSTMGEILQGKLDMNSPEGQRRLTETAGMFSPMPAASRVAQPAVGAVGNLVQRARDAYKTFVPEAPSKEALLEAAEAGYKAVQESGAEYSVPAVKDFAQNLRERLNSEGFIKPITGGVHQILSQLTRSPQGAVGVRASDLDAFRKRMSQQAGSADATTAAAANIAIRAVDEFVQTAGKTPSMAGPRSPAGATALAAREIVPARQNRAAAFRTETIEEIRKIINLRTGGANSGGNFDNTVRQKLIPLVTKAKQSRGFSPQELQAMEEIISGTVTKNTLRRISNMLGGGGGLGQSMLGGAAGMGAYSAGQDAASAINIGLGTMLAGNTARQARDFLANRQVDQLDNLIRSRSPLGGGGPVRQYAPMESVRIPARVGSRAAAMELGRALQQPKSLSENRPKSQLERQREEAYKRWFYGRGGGI